MMLKTAVVAVALTCAVADVVTAVALNPLDMEWSSWVSLHDREYETAVHEESARAQYFDNKARVESLNAMSEKQALVDGTPDEEILRLTVHGPWADMSNEAYRKMLLRQGAPAHRSNAAGTFEPKRNNINKSDDQSINWRFPPSGKSAVSRVKNQGQCGSCWSFSATGAIEGQLGIKFDLTAVSEQQLVDCDNVAADPSTTPPQPSFACEGGWVSSAYDYLMLDTTPGIATEHSYEYRSGTGVVGKCRVTSPSKRKPIAYLDQKLVSYMNVTQTQEALLDAVFEQPVAIAMDASSFQFQTYKQGIFSSCKDTEETQDHGVLIIGAKVSAPAADSTDKYGQGNYMVKNSWGTGWGIGGERGDGGYFMLAANPQPNKHGKVTSTCGSELDAVIPTLQ